MLNKDWIKKSLGELITIKHGYAFKGIFFSEMGNYILLTPGNFSERDGLVLKGAKEKYYIGKIPENYILKKDDLIIAMTDLKQSAPYLGAPAFIDKDDLYLHNQRLGLINIKNENIIDKKFLYWVFQSESFRAKVRGSATGTTVRHTAPKRIYKIGIDIPKKISQQKKIAVILSNYDDLIRINKKRILILEKISKLIYEEWFEKFRFPGHENINMVDSEVGKMPENWRITKISDFINFSNGKSVKVNNNGLYLLYGSNGVIGNSQKYNFENAIIIGRVGAYCGSVCYCSKKFSASDNTIVAKSKEDEIYNPFIFYLLKNMNLRKFAGGSAQPLLTQSTLKNLKIVCPPDEQIKTFYFYIKNILSLRNKILSINNNLSKTRDLLIPKLINGEIDVSDLNINITEEDS